ncbi:hypothetical protein OQA88_9345 [Cercophora sp. LCS_1]
MPIENYGVTKGVPRAYTFQTREEDSKSPHLHLYYTTTSTFEAHEAAINIKSGDANESRLAFWTVPRFTNGITAALPNLASGFTSLASGQDHDDLSLDYIRNDYFNRADVRILPHDVPGQDNDILDTLPPLLDRAIEAGANVYIWGSEFSSHKGIHNVHMNQGSAGTFKRANGIWQDGGLVFEFADHWEAIFIGFASQATNTDRKGDGVGRETWGSIANQ